MQAEKILGEIEKAYYWDARVLEFDIKHYGDEVNIIFEDEDGDVSMSFTGCSKLKFETSVSDRKTPIKALTRPQIPYFLQDIQVNDLQMDGNDLLEVKILMPPLEVELVCSAVSVETVKE